MQRSLLLVAVVFAAAVAVGWLVLRDMDDGPPALPRADTSLTNLPVILPAEPDFPDRFGPVRWREAVRGTNEMSAFVTTFFRPPPPPPPPVRKTQKFQLTYQGYFETAEGTQRAYVLVNDRLAVLPPGARVVGDVVITNIHRLRLDLLQAGTQALSVPFRGTREVEVPVE
ncbi:hypothetical protein [Limisphaera sp. VF-2]|uniref:hypothetical protein n=1 Tax=Limisphaera sp. VF-2 TaxID=3400418 RepID=UPI00176BD358